REREVLCQRGDRGRVRKERAPGTGCRRLLGPLHGQALRGVSVAIANTNSDTRLPRSNVMRQRVGDRCRHDLCTAYRHELLSIEVGVEVRSVRAPLFGYRM